jgi:GDP-L-fucose synthase
MCDAYRRQYGCNFISAMPTNLYGPGDNYHPEHSHVLPALIRRFHEAKQQGLPAVTCWGTGKPMREFLHVDDLASACLHLMALHNESGWVNVGTGSDVAIANLANMVAQTVGYKGQIFWDDTKPDGTPRKWLDVSRLARLGWTSTIALKDGLQTTYDDFMAAQASNSLRC